MGAPAPGMKEALWRAVGKGLRVVYANRGEKDRLGLMQPEEPFIAGESLKPQKARDLLILAPMKTNEFCEIRRIFDEYEQVSELSKARSDFTGTPDCRLSATFFCVF